MLQGYDIIALQHSIIKGSVMKQKKQPNLFPLRLNLGGGDLKIEGYKTVDSRSGNIAFPLDYQDNSVDAIRASHILEHFPHGMIGNVLADWVRVLKPGSPIRIAVPDFEWISTNYLSGTPINTQGLVHGSQDYPENTHFASFDFETLREAMVNAGLTRITRWVSEIADCSAQPYSLNLMGYKPIAEDYTPRGIFAIGSDARFGPSLHHKCVDLAISGLRIPVDKIVGCFWHQNISNKIEEHIHNKDIEFILTLDYDTIFCADDVKEMYRLMRAYPEADAIVPVQMKRTNDCALFNILDKKGNPKPNAYKCDFDHNLVQIGTGHFGLTLFRAEKIRKLPKPWMCPKPNNDGDWGKGHIDADIDFWLNWRKSGFTAFLAPRIVIGHMEELIVWPGEDIKPIYQNVADYYDSGKPAGAVIV